MKIFKLLVLILFFSSNQASAQDTLYIYRAGIVLTKRAVSEIDSITFYRNYDVQPQETVTDKDGNLYHTAKIGTQTWMVEDLKTTKYLNGDLIETTYPIGKDLTYEVSPKYQWAYNGNNSNALKYGRLYTWYAATDSRKIAPKGWHVASDAEWKTLQNYLITNGYNYDGTKSDNKIAKSLSSTSLWNTSMIQGAIGNDLTKNNSSGFSAVPAGYRGVDGTFYILNWVSDHWTSTEDSSDFARMYALGYTSPDLGYYSRNKKYGVSVRCIKDTLSLPELVTTTVSDITEVSALTGGQITSDGGSAITARGVCWSTTVQPTIQNNKTTETIDSVFFTSKIAGLKGDSTYFVRAYATNSYGTAYGAQLSFTTLKNGTQTVTDRDGNIYHTVKIGSQTWMVENLKTKKYCNGDLINTTVPVTKDISYEMAPNYQWAYDGNESNVSVYGRLYTWYAVNDVRKLAPVGWHVATDAEWTTLQNYLTENGYNYDGTTTGNKIAKSLSSKTLWTSSSNEGAIGNDLTKNNSSGFTSVPGGYHGTDGQFYWINSGSEYWTSTESTPTTSSHRVLGYSTSNIGFSNSNNNYGLSVRCVKDTIALPSISTTQVSAVTDSIAVSGGKITFDGGSTIIARGVCWSTSVQPTLLNNKTTENLDSVCFISKMTGLTSNSKYYVRAYATNSVGTAYGEQVSFNTSNTDSLTITDIDGNLYHTVTIGTQVWLKENLKVTRFNNGDLIPNVTDNAAWSVLMTGGYCWYNNDIDNKSTYGALYNWYTADDSRLIAPAGWHIASDADFTILTSYLGGESEAGNKMKENGINHWFSPNNFATNESGFTALPGGLRNYSDGTFRNSGSNGYFWSTSQSDSIRSWDRELFYDQANCFRYYFDSKHYGFSVRCVRNEAINLPVVHTMEATSVTDSTATLGGDVATGTNVIARGICWSNSPSVTITNNKTSEGSGNGVFSSLLTGLMSDSTYYVRAYATNSIGTAYGEQVIFKTLHNGSHTIADIDGNVYHTVTIGTQTWMAENLKTTRLNDNTSIPNVTDQAAWASLSTPGYCWYNNDSISYNSTLGTMYNWYTVETGKLAPKGWHVATDSEWEILSAFLGDSIAGGKLKEAGLMHWSAPNTGATNETNFTALPGGNRGQNNGTFNELRTGSFWWTSTVLDDFYSRFRSVGYKGSGVGKSGSGKVNGLYVRCIKD